MQAGGQQHTLPCASGGQWPERMASQISAECRLQMAYRKGRSRVQGGRPYSGSGAPPRAVEVGRSGQDVRIEVRISARCMCKLGATREGVGWLGCCHAAKGAQLRSSCICASHAQCSRCVHARGACLRCQGRVLALLSLTACGRTSTWLQVGRQGRGRAR